MPPSSLFQRGENLNLLSHSVLKMSSYIIHSILSPSLRMIDHRNNINEIIHEKLTGSPPHRDGSSAANEKQSVIDAQEMMTTPTANVLFPLL